VSIGPREYLQLVEKSKRAVRIPIIASLNCIAPGSWASYAKQIQDAGADALEVNIYALQADPSVSAEAIEQRYLATVSAVQEAVKIPVSVKLSPYFTALAHFAGRLDRQGVKGLVLFNRFLQPDISVERLELDNVMPPSNPHEALVPLRWIALLYGRVQADLAATTGVYDATGVVKQILAGASVVQVAWTLLKHGVPHVSSLVSGLDDFMDKRGYSELVDLRGLLSQKALKDPGAFERAQYVHLLLSQVS
jgi:dihydroorotate dehydrogenase (fumarate)